jgi:hypothetical protein
MSLSPEYNLMLQMQSHSTRSCYSICKQDCGVGTVKKQSNCNGPVVVTLSSAATTVQDLCGITLLAELYLKVLPQNLLEIAKAAKKYLSHL